MRLIQLPYCPKLALTGLFGGQPRLLRWLRPSLRDRNGRDLESGSEESPSGGSVASPPSALSYQMPSRGWSVGTESTKVG
jgi:hypothetical protein